MFYNIFAIFLVFHAYRFNIHILCRDCVYPVNTHEIRVKVCIQAQLEWLEGDFQDIKEIWESQQEKLIPPFLRFYECMIALNVETIDDKFEDNELRRSGKSFSRDYEMLTFEICFLGNNILLQQELLKC